MQYLSLRITQPHNLQHEIEQKILHDVTEWCLYKHGGVNDIAEHFHICVVGGNPERYRKRLRDGFGGGNKVYRVKQYTGDLYGFVFYCAHEGTVPTFKGDKWQAIIDKIASEGCYKKRRIDDHYDPVDKKVQVRDWILTYSNIVCQAILYREKHIRGETSLKRVIKHMIEHTKWRPSRDMYKNGVPDVYQKDFEFRIKDRTEFDMDWWTPKTFT